MCHFAHYNINIYIYIIVPLLTRSQRLMTRDLNDTRDRTNTSGGGRTEKNDGETKKSWRNIREPQCGCCTFAPSMKVAAATLTARPRLATDENGSQRPRGLFSTHSTINLNINLDLNPSNTPSLTGRAGVGLLNQIYNYGIKHTNHELRAPQERQRSVARL